MDNLQIDLFDTEISNDDISAKIDELAHKVANRRMETAAILFLEMHKPLAFLAGQSLIAASPFLVPLFGLEDVHKYSQVLGSRENVEALIRRIEQAADERETEENAQRRSEPIE